MGITLTFWIETPKLFSAFFDRVWNFELSLTVKGMSRCKLQTNKRYVVWFCGTCEYFDVFFFFALNEDLNKIWSSHLSKTIRRWWTVIWSVIKHRWLLWWLKLSLWWTQKKIMTLDLVKLSTGAQFSARNNLLLFIHRELFMKYYISDLRHFIWILHKSLEKNWLRLKCIGIGMFILFLLSCSLTQLVVFQLVSIFHNPEPNHKHVKFSSFSRWKSFFFLCKNPTSLMMIKVKWIFDK